MFLQSVRDNLVVRAGDLLARKYRVEGIDENALHLRYLSSGCGVAAGAGGPSVACDKEDSLDRL